MNFFRRKDDDQEVKLWSNKREREETEAKADLFALIKTVDRLEKAYVRDHIRCALLPTYRPLPSSHRVRTCGHLCRNVPGLR